MSHFRGKRKQSGKRKKRNSKAKLYSIKRYSARR